MPRRQNPNLPLENLDEDIARAMDRLDVLEVYKRQTEDYLKRVGDMLGDLRERPSAAEAKLAARR